MASNVYEKDNGDTAIWNYIAVLSFWMLDTLPWLYILLHCIHNLLQSVDNAFQCGERPAHDTKKLRSVKRTTKKRLKTWFW